MFAHVAQLGEEGVGIDGVVDDPVVSGPHEGRGLLEFVLVPGERTFAEQGVGVWGSVVHGSGFLLRGSEGTIFVTFWPYVANNRKPPAAEALLYWIPAFTGMTKWQLRLAKMLRFCLD